MKNFNGIDYPDMKSYWGSCSVVKSGNGTFRLDMNNPEAAKILAKISKLERSHARMFGVKRPVLKASKAIAPKPKPAASPIPLEQRILDAINSGMEYARVIVTFGIRDFQPFKSIHAQKWERVKVRPI